MLQRVRSNYASVVATLALIAALAGTAIAATTSATNNTVTACSVKKGKKKGTLRLASKCKKSEKKVTWNKTGPQGPAGAPGTPGAPGAAGASAVAPAHAVMAFNLAACPAGWSEFTPARGRYVVGLPPNGTLAGTDGTPLGDLEDRPTGKHDHGITDPGHSHDVKVDSILVGGNVQPVGVQGTANTDPQSYKSTLSAAAQTATTGITINPAGAVAGTNAPYVQLLVCEKS